MLSFCRYCFPRQHPSDCVVVLCLWLFLSLNSLMRVPLRARTRTRTHSCVVGLVKKIKHLEGQLSPTVSKSCTRSPDTDITFLVLVCFRACTYDFAATRPSLQPPIALSAPSVNMWVKALNLPACLPGSAAGFCSAFDVRSSGRAAAGRLHFFFLCSFTF